MDFIGQLFKKIQNVNKSYYNLIKFVLCFKCLEVKLLSVIKIIKACYSFLKVLFCVKMFSDVVLYFFSPSVGGQCYKSSVFGGTICLINITHHPTSE